MNVLVVDVGGSHVKVRATGMTEPVKFDSGEQMTPHVMVERVLQIAAGWTCEAVSLGIPCAVGPGGPEAEPGHLGDGWVGFDYPKAFGKPVRVVNDAAMQAVGGYDGGRMLFLGLGTGLGSALVTDRVVVPMELGCLKLDGTHTLGDRLGRDGRKALGQAEWMRTLHAATNTLRAALAADYVLLGGGNAAEVDPLPEGVRRGGNEDAFSGGVRLWEDAVVPLDRPPTAVWRVVR